MSNIQKNSKKRVFENPVLEALVTSNPYATAATYGVIISTELFINARYGFVSDWGTGIALYLSGLFIWTFFEYLLHRYVFHFVAESKFVQKFHYLVHGFHHEYPRDEDHLFMPPLPGLLLGAIFTGFFFLFLNTWAFVFTAGFINGYMLYAAIHYSTHKFKPPKMLKNLWTHHSIHHYKHPDKAFGVSSPIWDYIFGTMPPAPKKQAQRAKVVSSSAK